MDTPIEGYFFGHSVPGLQLNFFLGLLPILLLILWRFAESRFLGKWEVFFGILFILFLPNSLYLGTEARHLVITGDRVAETFSWEATLSFVGISIFGIVLTGWIILTAVKNIETLKVEPRGFIWILSFASAYGAALGVFERINSYEAFTNPMSVVTSIVNVMFSWSILAILLVTILYGVILTKVYNKSGN